MSRRREPFGVWLRAARGSMSLRQLAERAGTSASFLHDLEHGNRMPSRRVGEALAWALGVEFRTLATVALAEIRERAESRWLSGKYDEESR